MHHLVALIQGFKVQNKYKVRFSSSFLIEFYKRGDISQQDEGGFDYYYPYTLDRTNYYLKFYLDDAPLNLTQVPCDDSYRCNWDALAKYLEARQFRDFIKGNGTKEASQDVRGFCFSHLNYVISESSYVENLPWWLAFLIALPLVIITVAIIKIVLIVRDKKKRAQLAQRRNQYTQLNKNR